MRLPKQSAPVNRGEIFEPLNKLKEVFVIGIEPNNPAPFGLETSRSAICQILSTYAVAGCISAKSNFSAY
jgi:hypothetical protein